MSKSIAGLKRIGYSNDGIASPTWIDGKISPDSTLNPEITQTETTDGAISGGSGVTPEIHILSRASFDTLEGFSDNDTEKYWHLEYYDGRAYTSRVPFNIFVVDPLNTNMRDGVSAITITAEKFHTQSNLFELDS
jgi:hypothetical protein